MASDEQQNLVRIAQELGVEQIVELVKTVGTRYFENSKQPFYTPVQLSPVAPLGSCSVVATVDQNKVVSAVRGTEV